LRVDTQRLAVQEFSERAVGDAKTDIQGLELFVGEGPDATSRFNRGQWCKERVNRVRTLRGARPGRRRRALACSAAAASTFASESATTTTTRSTTTTATKSAAATPPIAARATRLPVADAGTLRR
jgi:hypothetical protein